MPATKEKNAAVRSGTIKVDYLARVEGEGALWVKIRKNKVVDAKFKIFEPPRFFEAFLRGRDYREAPDITARICGICPVAYQMSASQAMEQILGLEIPQPLRRLRRLLYCGEWIQSHALHVYMLHAPDFLGYESVLHMAKDFRPLVEEALQLKKTGNALMELLGGRAIHPINVTVGGFYKIPPASDFRALCDSLKWARDAAVRMVQVVSDFPFPQLERDYEFVALHHPDEYAILDGRLISNRGLDIAVGDYEKHFEEQHAAHTNALQSVLKARGAYHVGPLARFNLNYEQLSPLCREVAESVRFTPPCRNPFQSIIVRSLETLYACDEALRIIDELEMPDEPLVSAAPRAGTGYGCTEAPRGICWHKYTLDEAGHIQLAKIVPPTSQNQKTIEDDLFDFVSCHIDMPKEQLTWACEQAVRNYDPCISCATHFLRLDIDRE